jgi:signal transduction histidine kinase
VTLPSIRSRLANALLLWVAAWGLGVALAVGVAAQHEVDELLDESLQASALVLARALDRVDLSAIDTSPWPSSQEGEYAWQLVNGGDRLLARSTNAPDRALQRVHTPGFSSVDGWRVFGVATGIEGRMVYVAHTTAERREARGEVIQSAVLAALSIGLIGQVWLRLRVRRELQVLDTLSTRLASHDPLAGHTLGPAERAELAPVHRAIDDLGQRLARRVAHERAFASHAAHALRTPLAGMDAQLAVALRESPAELQPRLQRVRDASGRLQRVVRSLLDLFRVGAEVRRAPVEIKALVAHLPVEGLEVTAPDAARLDVDPDLVAAALANLLDNALRYGARRVRVSLPAPGVLRLDDDGRGCTAERRATLRAALAAQDYDGVTGLGLMLADLVARAHGGCVRVPDADHGFAVEMSLGEGAAPLPHPDTAPPPG